MTTLIAYENQCEIVESNDIFDENKNWKKNTKNKKRYQIVQNSIGGAHKNYIHLPPLINDGDSMSLALAKVWLIQYVT